MPSTVAIGQCGQGATSLAFNFNSLKSTYPPRASGCYHVGQHSSRLGLGSGHRHASSMPTLPQPPSPPPGPRHSCFCPRCRLHPHGLFSMSCQPLAIPALLSLGSTHLVPAGHPRLLLFVCSRSHSCLGAFTVAVPSVSRLLPGTATSTRPLRRRSHREAGPDDTTTREGSPVIARGRRRPPRLHPTSAGAFLFKAFTTAQPVNAF